MKLINIKAAFFVILGFSVVGAGCLKDKDFDNGMIQSVHGNTGKVVSLAINVQTTGNFTSLAYPNSNNDTIVAFVPVELSNGSSPAPQDIHVAVGRVDSLVYALDTLNYNNNDGTTYDYNVPAGVTLVDSIVTIAKGSYQGFLQIKFKPSNYLGQDVALGFKILGVQEPGYTISGNLNSGVISIIIKNKYDGFYGGTITTFGWGAYGIADGVTNKIPASANLGLFTSNANSVVFSSIQGNLEPAFATSGSFTAFGAATVQFSFDLTTNKLIGITNLTPDSRNRAFSLNPDPSTNSYYDPTKKTMYLTYLMTQNGRPTQIFYDTLTYTGSR